MDFLGVGGGMLPDKKSGVGRVRVSSRLALRFQEVVVLVAGGRVGEGETAYTGLAGPPDPRAPAQAPT